MRLGLSLASLLLAGLAVLAVAARLHAPEYDRLDTSRAILVSSPGASLPREARIILTNVRAVPSSGALDSALASDTNLIVIDRSAASDAAAGSLRVAYHRAIPIIAINTSLADLWRLTGQDEDLRAVDPRFAAEELARARCEGVCAKFDFWATTWRSCSGDTGGSGFGPFSPGHLSIREFETQVRRQLAIGGDCPPE